MSKPSRSLRHCHGSRRGTVSSTRLWHRIPARLKNQLHHNRNGGAGQIDAKVRFHGAAATIQASGRPPITINCIFRLSAWRCTLWAPPGRLRKPIGI